MMQNSVVCNKCEYANPPGSKFCQQCGSKIIEKISAEDKAKLHKGGTVLLVIAILQTAVGILFYFMNYSFDVVISISGIGIIFFFLYLWSKKSPFPAAIAGLVIYLTIHALEAFIDPASLARGIILKIFIISALVKAVSAGSKYKNIQQNK